MTGSIFLAHQKIDYSALIHLGFPVSLYDGNGGLPSECKGKTLVALPIDPTKEGGELIRIMQNALMAGSIPAAFHIPLFRGDKIYNELMPFVLEDEDLARITLETILFDPVVGGALEIQIPHEMADGPLVLPEGIMSGIAGDYARLYAGSLEPCQEFFYFSFLTCLGALLSGRLTLKSELHPQPRFYILLLGESADHRKSTAISQTISFFKPFDGLAACFGVGSAEGLAKRMENAPHLVLVYDEFRQFSSKCRIEGSVLLSMVTSLFENNHYENYTKTVEVKLENVHLSMLAASTIPTWDATYDPSFSDIGFLNRIFLVPGLGKRRFALPVEIPDLPKTELRYQIAEILKAYEHPKIMTINPDADAVYSEWYMTHDTSIHSKRLDTYALRFMPLLAANEGKGEVDLSIVEKAIAIMDWQLRVRQQLDPIDADGKIAVTEEKIRRVLRRGPLSKFNINHGVHYDRKGIYVFDQALKNLCKDEVIYDKKTGLFAIAPLVAPHTKNGGRL